MLMDERGLTMEQAMDAVYGSHTYEKVWICCTTS